MLFFKNTSSVTTSLVFILVCMIFILGFQLLWLQSSYRVKKQEFLKESENVFQQELILLSMPDVKSLLTKLSNVLDQLSDDQIAKIDKGDTAIPEQWKKNKILTKSLDKVLLKKTEPALHIVEEAYAELAHKQKWQKSGLAFSVNTYQEGRLVSSYPQTQKNDIGTDTTSIVSILDPQIGYQLSFTNLQQVILKSMAGQIVLSLVFIIIAAITFIILLQNIGKNKRLFEIKSAFTYNVAHELKIPVATLAVATEAMEKYNTLNDPAIAKRHISLMRGDIRRLSDMIDSILSNARLEHGHIRLQQEDLSLQNLLDEVKDRLQLQLARQEGILDFSGIPGHLTIYADKEQFISVLTNLADNAIKYTRDNPVIKFEAERVRDTIKIKITDNGAGIARHYWQQIFEPYFRIQDDQQTVSGYGLGLSQVKHIIRLHKGNIQVLSSNPSGTVFLLTIPVKV